MTMRFHTQVVTRCLSTTETSSTPPCIQPGSCPSDISCSSAQEASEGKSDSDEEVVAAIRQWCREQSPEFFADGIRQLVRRYQLCVDRDGDYVEKINMRCVAEVSSFNLMYNLSMYYEKQKSYDKTELTFQPTLVSLLYLTKDLDFREPYTA